MSESYSLQQTYGKLDALILDLEKIAPNPAKGRVIDIDHEYTPQELRDLLQRFGSYLTNLHAIEARLEAECHAINEAMKTGISVSMLKEDKGTVKEKEASVLANNEGLRLTRGLQIDNESQLIIIQGWRKAYESAYTTASRLVTLMIGELQMEGSNRTL